jgi:hypothetical protein
MGKGCDSDDGDEQKYRTRIEMYGDNKRIHDDGESNDNTNGSNSIEDPVATSVDALDNCTTAFVQRLDSGRKQ